MAVGSFQPSMRVLVHGQAINDAANNWVNTSSHVPPNFTRIIGVDTEVVNARRDDNIAEGKVSVGNPTSNANNEE